MVWMMWHMVRWLLFDFVRLTAPECFWIPNSSQAGTMQTPSPVVTSLTDQMEGIYGV